MEKVPEIIRMLSEGYKLDVLKTMSLTNSLIVSSPIGIPLTFNHTVTEMLKVNGQIKLDIPSISDIWNRQLVKRKLSMSFDLKPR